MTNEDNDLSRVDTTGNAESSRTASTNEKAPRILTIDRSKWYRGKGGDNSVLLNESGQMCCLGFDALACGLSPDEIRGRVHPYSVYLIASAQTQIDHDGYFTSRLIGFGKDHAPAVTAAITANDSEAISEEQREELIRRYLIAIGWDDVVFVDEGGASDARFTDLELGKATGSATKESEIK